MMKKLLILIGMVVLLAGCQGALEREQKAQRAAEKKAIVASMRVVEYGAHSYIVYRETYGTKNFGGLTHDPDCWCNNPAFRQEIVTNKICDCEDTDTIR